MSITRYLDKVNRHYQSGHATEHSYRGDFSDLVQNLAPTVHITNEPNNVTDCGNPDYVITQKKIPVGFIEAKDLGKDLNSKQFKEQFGRYRKALDNLIITDYVWFQFYENGEKVNEIRIAEIDGLTLNPLPENFDQFSNLIKNFCTFISQTIKSPKTLAEMMAAKARLLENILEKAITTDENNNYNSELQQQYDTFKEILIHDLTPKGFADIYAQTLAYGMFAARLHDKTLDTFSRQEAAELIPKSNPFLRKLFDHLAGTNIDERIVTTVDNLADVFRATNVKELLKNFGKSTRTHDPIIHFYETFLAEYDPKLRKARGVWYTPEPVVNFIVRSVDELLKTEFGLKDGLANTDKTTVEVEIQGTAITKGKAKGKRLTEIKEVHKVQVLDPSTGTGTFLAEVVKFIYSKKFKSMQGAWTGYVEEHLIPRLNGFELLMASYSMAHLKLDMLLAETGYKAKKRQRFNIFLTNTLEEHHPDTGSLFSTWLSTEANEANSIKRDTPVMVVLGNPPYSVNSANTGEWIMELMGDYKKEPGSSSRLNERNPKVINDDYVKFIRYAQYLIEKNGEGIVAFITPHGFLDNPTFRGMRWNLLKIFDTIYSIDLHGNSKKKEISPDGSPDMNIFDIQQGVSINFFIKKKAKKLNQLASMFHYDLFGRREHKNNFLSENELYKLPFKRLEPQDPMYYMVPKNYELIKKYNQGFSIEELFIQSGMGIYTGNDKELVFFSSEEANIYHADLSYLKPINYRIFDSRLIYMKKELVERPRRALMHHMESDNISLICIKRVRNKITSKFGITDGISDKCFLSTLDNSYVFPLFLYPQNISSRSERVPNLNTEIVKQIDTTLNEASSPFQVFDYIYAVIHSVTYRNKYREFIEADFPRIPYPKDTITFYSLVSLGRELRHIHLLNSDILENHITSYPADGNNLVTRKIVKSDWDLYDCKNKLGRVWINDEQYFEGIPLKVWDIYIGGYQPAQKWLKDRSDRTLSFSDILHYQKIIVALSETDRIMHEIDKIDFE